MPHWFVIGFLGEVWREEYERGSCGNRLEPEYQEWVIVKRAMDDAPQLRGIYPEDIQEKADALRPLVAILLQTEGRFERFGSGDGQP